MQEGHQLMNKRIAVLAFFFGAFGLAPAAFSHCQVPCGIYDDHARVQSMLEDAQTAKKSVDQISALAGKSDPQSSNQLNRWISNKEDHAQRIISTISDYFLTQRVKPSQSDYDERLRRHHAVIVASMKVKQNADMKHVRDLEMSIQQLQSYYPEHKH